jgi:hypothetical protein
MRHDHAIGEAVAKIKRNSSDEARRARLLAAAEKDLGHVALCLIGPPKPVIDWKGGNALRWPVGLRSHKQPETAAQRTASEHWEGSKASAPVTTLAYVWTANEAHAARLRAEMHTLLLGHDPEMTRLNSSWVDVPHWEIAWVILLDEAIRSLHSRRDMVEAFGDDERERRIRQRAGV